MSRMRAIVVAVALLSLAATLTACREEGEIQISSLEFEGVSQVDKGALANALKTKKGSWLPWGRKRYFDRRAFERKAARETPRPEIERLARRRNVRERRARAIVAREPQ